MIKVLSHRSQPEKHQGRTYAGEVEADHLIEWLNRPGNSAAGKRITSLLNDIREIARLLRNPEYFGTWHWNLPKEPRPGVVALSYEEYLEIRMRLRNINKRLARYRFWPKLEEFPLPRKMQMLYRNDPAVRWRSDFRGAVSDFLFTEQDAVRGIVELYAQNYLGRVRPCDSCRKWFFARFGHQLFCSTKCQQQSYRSKPAWKEHRRKWMRDHRRAVEIIQAGVPIKKK
jgi:hypothetical protein